MTKKTLKKNKEFEAWARKWKLNKEEREELRSFEADEWEPLKGEEFEEMKRFLQASARYTLRKDKSISIRLPAADLDGIKARAMEEGLPYQTLIASLIHKHALKHRAKSVATDS